MDELIADLRQYMGSDVPTGTALKALSHARTELPQGAGNAWLIQRAAYLIRRADRDARTSNSG